MRALRSVLALLAFAACDAATSPPGGPDAPPGTPDGPGPGQPDARPGTPDAGTVPTSSVSIIVEPDGQGGKQLVNAINAATQSVYMTMYQIDNSAVISALVARKQAGLDVQVVLDGSSTNKSWNTTAYNQFVSAGISVVWSSTAFTYTHEKCVIIDGKTAWIMTMNANTSSPKDNREYLAIDTDAADIAEATAVFTADHAKTGITPTGQLVVANTNARAKLVALIDGATSTVDVEDEEFSDTYSTGVVNAVTRAAQRGVKVRVIVANDSSPPSSQTLAIGYVKSAGGKVVVTGPTSGNGTASNPYIHAKAITIDCNGTTCARGWVGSENMTGGSLGYNRELGVIFDDATELAKVQAAIDTDFAAGKPQ